MSAPALLPFELVFYFECFACSSVVLIIGEQWKCVSQRQISKTFKTHLLEKVVWRWRSRSRKLQTWTTFANFPHWRHLTFYISTTSLNFSHPALLWLWQRPSPHSLAYPRTKFACRTRRRWGTCAQKWTSSSNLSEVCSGSDACDNNMGSLTKWDRNPAQNIC